VKRLLRAAGFALAMAALLPAVTQAHPLGNFTINHFAGLRADDGQLRLDVVIDRAEIPAFQQTQELDTDGDGQLSTIEREYARRTSCDSLAAQLSLAADGTPLTLQPTAAGISFPPGAGGLPTVRLVCEYVADLPAGATAGTIVRFADDSFAERIGWREIVSGADHAGISNRLTSYPEGLLAQPLDVRAVELDLAALAGTAADWSAPDAEPLAGDPAGVAEPSADSPAASVPGGIGSELAALIDADELSPAVLLGSLLIAIVLGAAHALSPGHGKTIMAAYLVGTRGTARHAIALGMTVTVSHTLGVLLLALVTLAASSVVPPERLYPVLGVGSGLVVVLIGAWLLLGRLRSALADRRHASAHARGHGHSHDADDGLDHEHGHSHAPASGMSVSWRGLFALGLSGGLVPSVAALVLLLGSIAAGRIAYGLLLVVGFGAGMALVLGGVGLGLVYAARLLERLPARGRLGRSGGLFQLASAGLVLVLGVMLTGQALTQIL
jgi:ABC-type nickel/cobalt efflux system permease component RcnA